MLIDWFTVVAQITNFLVLVWLLKRYLYKPILATIAKREQLIAKELSDASDKDAKANTALADFAKKSDDFDKARDDLMAKAVAAAETERKRLFGKAKDDSDAERKSNSEAIEASSKALATTIVLRTRKEVFAGTRKVLADLASTTLEAEFVTAFLAHLAKLSADDAKKLNDGPPKIRSAFPLSPDQQKSIQDALHTQLAPNAPIAFETSPDVICGVELFAGGTKVAWSVADYVSDFEKSGAVLVTAS